MSETSGGRLGSNRTVLPSVAGQHRGLIQATMDGIAWCAALAVATLLRYDFAVDRVGTRGLVLTMALAVGLQTLAGFASGLYLTRWRYGSFDEVSALVRTVLVAGAAVFVVVVWNGSPYLAPRGAVAGGTIMAIGGMAALRWTWRMYIDRKRRPGGDRVERLIVFGAGEAGSHILESLLRDPDSAYLPVALLDDDRRKRKLRILGVPVLGGREDLQDVARRTEAKTLLIAIPSAGGDLVRDVAQRASDAGVLVKILPAASDLFRDHVTASDIRGLTEADLLGRRRIETDVDSIAGYLTDKKVLVTGAGGSIGSELCRQIARYAPAQLMMLDRDESALHAVQLSIEGRATLDSPNLVLADIRDIEHMERLFADRRPDVVFHAAALKHLTLLEQYPGEAVKSNVWGTLTVLQAAAAAGVERFVNISTDKAANPTSVLGYSKRIAERLTAHIAQETEGCYLSVRFGNVLGSRGSVLTAFRAQIAAGGPITVTDPDVTRFFMTVEEAVELVIQAGAIGRDGEALVLDMGEPVKIDDVARRMAEQADRPIRIVYTGLRPGEKMHEELFGEGEVDERRVHPSISHVPVPPVHSIDALALDAWADNDKVIASLGELAATAAFENWS